ncbi:MAG: acyl-CoA/acyl-ACP dehydrogenase [Rhodospirillaceae bacterium]|nr:acyl-CoA/acyl-ACP dehydrogenase [Rhodospirillaceae bacterium]
MNEERIMIAETCERLFAAHLDAEVFRTAEAGRFPHGLWDAITENGLDRILVPEAQGGSGLGWEDAHVVLLAAGRHAAPVPLAEAIAAGGLLGQLPDGIVTLGTSGADPEMVRVPWGRDAGHMLVSDADDGLRCVSLDGAAITRDRNIGRDPRDGVVVEGLVTGNMGVDQVHAAGALVRSCQMAGAVSAVLDLCVTYTNERVQFGRPIGRFQAIQQQLAVMAGEAAAAGVAARAACRMVDAGGNIIAAAATAKIRTGEAAGKAANIAHQVHGAIGFTDEYRLHHLTRRLWGWRSEFGAESNWAGLLGRLVAARGADKLWPDLTDG